MRRRRLVGSAVLAGALLGVAALWIGVSALAGDDRSPVVVGITILAFVCLAFGVVAHYLSIRVSGRGPGATRRTTRRGR